MNRSFDALAQVRSVRAQLKERAARAKGAVADAIAVLTNKRRAGRGGAEQFLRLPPGAKQPENFSSLNQHFSGILSVADSADAAPTIQASHSFKELRKTRETRRSLDEDPGSRTFRPLKRQAEKSQACTDRSGQNQPKLRRGCGWRRCAMSRWLGRRFSKDGNEKLANISHRAWFTFLCFSGFVMASVERAQQIPEIALFRNEMADDRAISLGEGVCGGGPCLEIRASTILARMAACLEDDGRRTVWKPIFGQGGRLLRLERWRWRRRIRKSFLRGNGCQHDFCRQQLWRWNLQIRGWRRELQHVGWRTRGTSGECLIDATESGRRAVAAMVTVQDQRRARRFSLDGVAADVKKVLYKDNVTAGDRPLFVEPGNPRVVYAAAVARNSKARTRIERRPSYGAGGAGGGSYINQSDEGSVTWNQITGNRSPFRGEIGGRRGESQRAPGNAMRQRGCM